jgi:preprotein translocase subunit SecE
MAVNTIIQFFQEVHTELAKVTWPTKEDFIGSVIVTFILVTFFAVYLGLLDVCFSMLARFLFRWYGS